MIRLAHREIAPGEGHAAGRALLEELVLAHTGKAMPPILLTERGKPYFPGQALHFSITHTDHHVFCALSDCPVGIDAEETDRNISLQLAQKILSPGELLRWQASADRRTALLRLWVLKEARGKYLGTGLNGYPNHTDFSPADPRITEHHGCYVAVIQEDDYAL